ncbi:MAG TPA: hypothetical protein VJR23_10385 [Candidatus Acidoferrales bacterium]|nr:hypothetical protein [Candidatus Acidoferrales bacterium]
MNRKTLGTIAAAILLVGLMACNSSKYTPPPPQETITATSGSAQSATVSTAFAAPLVATVTTGSTADSGVSVTFTAPGTGASGTFAGGGATATVSTDSNGHATSPVFTANGAAGSYTVTATASGATGTASFSLSNTSVAVTTQSFSFYAAGTDTADDFNFTIAGAVTVDSNGNVTGGEQDFNDGVGLTSPEPAGDSITGGTLVVSASGQGTLTLTTNNVNWPEEIFAVNFVNTDHALITEFDNVGTSTGSLDLQTMVAPTGSFAFTGAGIGLSPNFPTTVVGGVFTFGANTLSGTIDIDSGGTVALGSAFGATVGNPDTFGRGSLTNTTVGITFMYYIVGGEAIRFIDVDTTDTLLGSAFGQGDFAGGYSASSIGQSVISFTGTPIFVAEVLAGQISTTPATGAFNGVVDVDEGGTVASGSPILGTYSMASTGYGSLSITNGGALDAATLGVYAVDPNLNINDPNNPSGGGGALVADLDSAVTGIGVLVPQTDTTATDFTGPYAFDGQFVTINDEADFGGLGTVSGTAFSGTASLNDPFDDFGALALNSGVTFGGTLAPDGANPGRFDLSPLNMTFSGGAPIALTVSVYQASGGQLFWIEEGASSVFSGQLQQQPANPTFPAVKKAGPKVTAAKAAAPKAVSPKANK